MHSPRIDSLVSSFLGYSSTHLSEAVTHIKTGLNDEQTKRLNDALSERICIFPDRRGMYVARSYSEDGYSKYSLDLKYSSSPTCTCSDFMFRHEPNVGWKCKHLWKAQVLITLGILPEPGENSYIWLVESLKKDIELMESAQEDIEDAAVVKSQLKSILADVEDTHEIQINYPSVCSSWGTCYKDTPDIRLATIETPKIRVE